MTFDELVEAIKAFGAEAGLGREDLARTVAGAVMGEEVAMLTAPAGFSMLALTEAASRRGPTLTASEREMVERCGLDPDRMVRRERQRAGGAA